MKNYYFAQYYPAVATRVWRCMVRWTTGGENAGQRNGAKAVRCIDRTGKS